MQALKKLSLLVLLWCSGFMVKAQTANTAKPFSAYQVHNGVIYVSGQIGVSPATGKLVNTSFNAEVNQVMDNIKGILNSAGSNMASVINVTVYLKDISQYAAFNQAYSKYFSEPYPARACVAVKDLAAGANLEIAVIAAQKNP